MRDNRFIALHRGGRLSPGDHRLLIRWARLCVEHALPLAPAVVQEIGPVLQLARDWEEGRVGTGAAMQAAREAHRRAREQGDPLARMLVRAAAQAVSTAHMADHCAGAAYYCRKAVREAGGSVAGERAWQEGQMEILPVELREALSLLLLKVNSKN